MNEFFVPAYQAHPIDLCAFIGCKSMRHVDMQTELIRRWCGPHCHLRDLLIAAEGGGELLELQALQV